MASFRVCFSGQQPQLLVDLPFADLGEFLMEASRARFLAGNMVDPDQDGVCRGVMIATSRIHCVFET